MSWQQVKVHSVHPLWGGYDLQFNREGAGLVRLVQPGGAETVHPLQLDEMPELPLPWESPELPRQLLPDTVISELVIELEGETLRGHWAQHAPLPPRLGAFVCWVQQYVRAVGSS